MLIVRPIAGNRGAFDCPCPSKDLQDLATKCGMGVGKSLPRGSTEQSPLSSRGVGSVARDWHSREMHETRREHRCTKAVLEEAPGEEERVYALGRPIMDFAGIPSVSH